MTKEVSVAERAMWILRELRDTFKAAVYVELHPDDSGVFYIEEGATASAIAFLTKEAGSERWEQGIPTKGYLSLAFCHMNLDTEQSEAVTPPITYPFEVDDQARVQSNFAYHPPKPGQDEKYVSLRYKGQRLAEDMHAFCPPSRERNIALNRLEEAMMWANASIARNE